MSNRLAILIFVAAVILGLFGIGVISWKGCQLVNSGIKLMEKQVKKKTSPQCPIPQCKHERMK